MLETRQSGLRFKLLALLVLLACAAVIEYDGNVARADNYSAINACYYTFGDNINNCFSTSNTCSQSCNGDPGCVGACVASCEADAIHTWDSCLVATAEFQMEECPNAAGAAAVCDATYDYCASVADELQDTNLAADCWSTWDTCMWKSGYWQCT